MAYVVDHVIDQYGTSINSTSELLPYVPQTYNDLLGAIGTYGAYVRLESDFDFSESSDYKISLPEIIEVKCAKLFANDKDQNGNKYLISGVNTRGLNTFMMSNGYDGNTYINPEIDNIGIVNSVYSVSNVSSNLFTSVSDSNTHIDFINCQLGFLVICNQWTPKIDGGNVTFTNTSEYYKFVQSDSAPYSETRFGVFYAKRYCCTVQFTGLKFKPGTRAGTYVGPLLIGISSQYIENCTIYGDIKCTGAEQSAAINLTSYKNCVFVLTFESSIVHTISSTSYSGSTSPPAGINILDSSVLGSVEFVQSYNTAITPLTSSEMKDENTLISIGFLP